ncbi:bifunctional 3-deoxy-7-phosphoheptulonate synthase/chorismate mutase [Deinococcus radiophilus]|uniref:3-deoxy-7-phosphoheptulonate synthase n=1 Tax=Deinococcus radiophilus TaxID=32062 RepID=A0A3S0L3M9_9DEIO|nr:bifunctional 3-deoxy-7-phosphoheptulonate synthase/chorismate mutase [Deinococcus radiophilus]RTR26250.1 3-deoxy-7-phosphoheptulonate synthase [Deinococcus radiophilus]UFA50297.1 bifunctional 3-deoxy-7-phosphoheptulonate synthase/chorismate mutase [Deinococcus radiophilus]
MTDARDPNSAAQPQGHLGQLDDLREQVDQINLQLLDLLSRRGELVAEIGRLKSSEGGTKFYDPKREEDQLRLVRQANRGPFTDAAISAMFKEIFKASLDLEETREQRKLLVSRKQKSEDTVLTIGDVRIGGSEAPVLIAGPCAIESEGQMDQTAALVKELGGGILRGGAYKPRTSPYGFQGMGVDGLQLGRKVADRHGMQFMTEVMDTRDVEVVAQYADILQIGARNMHNFSLLREVGAVRRPVLLKRGLSATMEEWLYAAEYILSGGNENVIMCERGIRTFEKWTRNTLDLSAVALIKQESHLPVVVDVTHAAGRRDLLLPLARAALAVGADGIHVEVHPQPATAMSDNEQQLDFEGFRQFVAGLNLISKQR